MSKRLMGVIRAVDDFLIDHGVQPFVNIADWYFGLSAYAAAKISISIGAAIGLIWVRRFFPFPSLDFYQALLCLGVMVVCTWVVTMLHEKREPKRSGYVPLARLTGLALRGAWLLYPLIFLTQLAAEPHAELALNFLWTAFVVLPYWLICCRAAPPPAPRLVLRPVPVTVR
jgi:hypothetical protein